MKQTLFQWICTILMNQSVLVWRKRLLSDGEWIYSFDEPNSVEIEEVELESCPPQIIRKELKYEVQCGYMRVVDVIPYQSFIGVKLQKTGVEDIILHTTTYNFFNTEIEILGK